MATCDAWRLASDRIGIVVGFAAEARIARRLGGRVAIGGATPAIAGQRLIDDGCNALISLGLAGGLDPSLRPGVVVVPAAVVVDGVHHPTDPHLSHLLGGVTAKLILGAETATANAAEKHRLYRITAAAAVDLESGAVARTARVHGIPFAVLRVICDPAERSLPDAALAALDSHGTIRIGRLSASIAANPGQLPALLRLAADAAAARRSLRARVRQIAPSIQSCEVSASAGRNCASLTTRS